MGLLDIGHPKHLGKPLSAILTYLLFLKQVFSKFSPYLLHEDSETASKCRDFMVEESSLKGTSFANLGFKVENEISKGDICPLKVTPMITETDTCCCFGKEANTKIIRKVPVLNDIARPNISHIPT